MKRMIVGILVVILIFQSVALAEIDLSTMSDDDLLALEAQIKVEKNTRGLLASTLLIEGKYKVGIDGDFPAGRYTIMYENSDKKSSFGEYYWLYVSIVDEKGNELSYKEMTTEYTDKPIVSFYFPEGSTFIVQNAGAVVRLIKSEGVVFE